MKEFDFMNTDPVSDLFEMAEHFSPEEAAAVISVIKEIREEKEKEKMEDFKKWFDAAFLPILKDFASEGALKLNIHQDHQGDITVILISHSGIDVTVNQKRMHMVISAADHLSVDKCRSSDDLEFTLIFGLPENEKQGKRYLICWNINEMGKYQEDDQT